MLIRELWEDRREQFISRPLSTVYVTLWTRAVSGPFFFIFSLRVGDAVSRIVEVRLKYVQFPVWLICRLRFEGLLDFRLTVFDRFSHPVDYSTWNLPVGVISTLFVNVAPWAVILHAAWECFQSY